MVINLSGHKLGKFNFYMPGVLYIYIGPLALSIGWAKGVRGVDLFWRQRVLFVRNF